MNRSRSFCQIDGLLVAFTAAMLSSSTLGMDTETAPLPVPRATASRSTLPVIGSSTLDPPLLCTDDDALLLPMKHLTLQS